MGQMVQELSREQFQKVRKLLNFRKGNHSKENSRNFKIKIKWNRGVFENLGIPQEVVLFF